MWEFIQLSNETSKMCHFDETCEMLINVKQHSCDSKNAKFVADAERDFDPLKKFWSINGNSSRVHRHTCMGLL